MDRPPVAGPYAAVTGEQWGHFRYSCVYYALCERDFTQVAVINPAHAKALRGHKNRRERLRAAGGVVRVR